MLTAVHFEEIQRVYTNIGVLVLVGQPNTNKSFLSKVAASLLGVHRTGIYNHHTAANLVQLFGKSLFFVLNDTTIWETFGSVTGKVNTIASLSQSQFTGKENFHGSLKDARNLVYRKSGT